MQEIHQNQDDIDRYIAIFAVLKKANITFQDYPKLYEAASQQIWAKKHLSTMLTVLGQAGISHQDYPKLYEVAIQNILVIKRLPAVFEVLRQAGISHQDYPELYETAMEDACYPEKLSAVFSLLRNKACKTVQEHKKLYERVMRKPMYADQLIVSFAKLEQAGIGYQDHPTLYENVIQNPDDGNVCMRLAGCVALKKAGINFSDRPMLYNTVIQGAMTRVNELTNGFEVLQEAGISYQDYPELYEDVIRQIGYAYKLVAAFEALKDVVVAPTQQNYLALYIFVAQNLTANIQPSLDKIKQLDLKVPDDFEIIDNALRAGVMGLNILTWLQENKLQRDSHSYIYKVFFSGSPPLIIRSLYYASKIKCQLQDYFQINVPRTSKDGKAYHAQCQEVQQLIDKVLSADNHIAEGPLNKSAASLKIEEILHRITIEDINNIRMQYIDAVGYLLQFGNEPSIYLSELLKLVNFNHVELSDNQVTLLGAQIEAILGAFLNNLCDPNDPIVMKMLPDAARRAVNMYISAAAYYQDINRLFRGVKPTSASCWVKRNVHSDSSIIANFLVGSLINWSAAELPKRLLYSEHRQILEKVILERETPDPQAIKQKIKSDPKFYEATLQIKLEAGIITREEYAKVVPLFSKLDTWFPSYGPADRGEDLEASEKDGELGIEQRRTANPVFAPSVMSFSIFRDGSGYFNGQNMKHTKIETDNSTKPIINSTEGEILAAHGTTYLYTQNPAGGFFAREINSPGMIPKGGYLSSVAIAEAYQNYLSKPYAQQEQHQITMDGINIQRPNHGLAHTYRVMIYIDVVINYFAHHAKDETFRLFCHFITPDECEWLRMAAAYAITGRENECSATENLALYDEAREASQEHMQKFLTKYSVISKDGVMRERMLDIVRWMGNPGYENAYQGKPAINQHTDINERLHRNFIYRILTLAHQLDLPRCYGPVQFSHAMEMALKHVTQSHEQQIDYILMLQYAINLINAHGDCLNTNLTSSGELISCSMQYRAPFHKVSSNLRQLREITETIPISRDCTENLYYPNQ
ncbi:MAG: hypothetical protein A3F43_03300 [Gammaproteobacteria bacterium RIFCSPHIGHO2_12_FULL_42_10]|nr:MAG: hypothetical protein A3F43_03300 [Gammaproteobacteria bacterium RIFCSPHIGHO2_12_FULL_42_10]